MDAIPGRESSVADRTVLVRADFHDGVTAELASLAVELAQQGARIAVISGLGNPSGDINPALSLARFAEPLAHATGRPVTFIPESVGIGAEAKLARVPFGEIALLENLRFHPDENRRSRVFAIRLSVLGDFYIDAGRAPSKENGWQAALRALLPDPGNISNNQPVDEDA